MKNEDNARLSKACQGRQDARNGFANCVNGFLIEFRLIIEHTTQMHCMARVPRIYDGI